MQNEKIGTLYVVATPIGNLKDITQRAIDILKQVDRIAAEDTRHSAPLLKHYCIDKPILCLHDFNEQERLAVIIDYLEAGESIALISDAGTPLISDPGFQLVRKAKAFHLPVVPIPGPCAAITALSVAGLPTDRFTFEGFLPAKAESCKNRLNLLRYETRTMIFYEAPHRLETLLQSLEEVFGLERQVCVARELTKLYESIITGTLQEVMAYYASHPTEIRGEIVILVAGLVKDEMVRREVIPEEALDILMQELPLKQAVTLASKITGERKNVLYELALQKKGTS